MNITQLTSTRPEAVLRKDYRPAPYRIDEVALELDLDPERTRVKATLSMRRDTASAGADEPLVLIGEELELIAVKLNGQELAMGEFEATADALTIPGVPDRFELETEVEIRPRANTRLMGLFLTSENFCTQCEAEGFRRITYFLDRPDVMARYTTRIVADAGRYPVLLSNGNRVASGDMADGRHWVRWEDPFPKPSYLFALVAGKLVSHCGEFVTRSGRRVPLEIWVEPQNADKCEHALRSLQNAMKWDEETFGLEYDLDLYMVVAVNDFNMGAMENKGLNVFNSKFVLARPDTATDADYEDIEGVIGHEYFHNWTGNRVTCRDWFQLTLKEGLTVFRDQQFSADMTSAPVKRIQDVKQLRIAQFAEDAGPMAHPIRPESYVEMNNFYTATVYEKGAEVIRLYHTLLGSDGFRKGLDLYFERHDGQAVTCDDFRAAMADANGRDLKRLGRWYEQPGTPVLEARGAYDAQAGTYTLTLAQRAPKLVGEAAATTWQPLHVPVRMGLVGPDGRDVPLRLDGDSEAPTSRVLELTDSEAAYVFHGLETKPVPSLLRGFSAPVRLEMERGREELAFLMAHDSDSFNRWEAGQELAKRLLLASADDHAAGREPTLDPLFVEAFGKLLDDTELDGSMKSLALTLPEERPLGQEQDVIDPDAIHAARSFVVRELADAHRDRLHEIYERHSGGSESAIDKGAIDDRRLKNRALAYLSALDEDATTALVTRQFEQATNMTDSESALYLLVQLQRLEREEALTTFHARWKGEPLVLDKWFRLQALSTTPDAFERVQALAQHPDFKLENPNRARSLIGVFGMGNQLHFHRPDGAGYAFVADHVLQLDALNPQVASRVVSTFNQWRRFDAGRRDLMQAQLERIAARPGLSKDVGEIVGRALQA